MKSIHASSGPPRVWNVLVGRRPVLRSGARGVTIVLGAVLAAVVGLWMPAWAEPAPGEESAQQILQAAEMRGGLIVHLGCGDGRLTAALHRDEHHVVQGLERDAGRVAQARAWLQKLGIYGPVSARLFDGTRLPYADNLVNLVVAENLDGVSRDEALRVLAPGGKLCVKEDGQWTITAKPRPNNIDEWTHFLHDASGNAVAHDDQVAPPGSLQWTEGPRYMRSHEHIPGIYALVSAGGRIFYIVDEAPTASVRRVPEWQLVARDAFNGILLWKKPIATWYPPSGELGPDAASARAPAGQRGQPSLRHARVARAADRRGCRDGRDHHGVYADTQGTEEVLWHQGMLLLVVRRVTAERLAEQEEWARLIRRGEAALEDRDAAEPLVKRLRATRNAGRAEHRWPWTPSRAACCGRGPGRRSRG